jgi:ankyrin repeat protein
MNIFFSAAIGNIPKINALLIENPELICETDRNNRTPLFYPIIYRRKETLRFLLSLPFIKPDFDHVDSFGLNVYDYAYYTDSRFNTGYLPLLESFNKSSFSREDYISRWNLYDKTDLCLYTSSDSD